MIVGSLVSLPWFADIVEALLPPCEQLFPPPIIRIMKNIDRGQRAKSKNGPATRSHAGCVKPMATATAPNTATTRQSMHMPKIFMTRLCHTRVEIIWRRRRAARS